MKFSNNNLRLRLAVKINMKIKYFNIYQTEYENQLEKLNKNFKTEYYLDVPTYFEITPKNNDSNNEEFLKTSRQNLI